LLARARARHATNMRVEAPEEQKHQCRAHKNTNACTQKHLDDVQRQFVMVPGQACQYCGTECESGPTNESYCTNCVDAYYAFMGAAGGRGRALHRAVGAGPPRSANTEAEAHVTTHAEQLRCLQ